MRSRKSTFHCFRRVAMSAMLCLCVSAVNVAPAETPWRAEAFALPDDEQAVTITGEVDFPLHVPCAEGQRTLPAVVLLPGSGEFDRAVDFGTSGTAKDLLFTQLTTALVTRGIAVVRHDYRGVHCNKQTMPRNTTTPAATSREVTEQAFRRACIDPKVRQSVTPDTIRRDFKHVYAYAAHHACLDPARMVVFAHSEGTIHAAHLLHDGAIAPRALVFMGMVAESPHSLVHWQAVDRSVGRLLQLAADPERVTNEELHRGGVAPHDLSPHGAWTRAELVHKYEAEYQRVRAAQLAGQGPPDPPHSWRGFWPQAWWRMWWEDETRTVDLLTGFSGDIFVHHGAADTQVSASRQFNIMRAASGQFTTPPRLVLHTDKGHTLGPDGLMGPISDDSLMRLVTDLVRALGMPEAPASARPPLRGEELNRRPYFGVVFSLSDTLPPAARYRSEFGLLIRAVSPGFPAWEAGVRIGDVLIAMNGEEIGAQPRDNALSHFIDRVQALAPGSTAELLVLRWQPEVVATRDGTDVAPPPGEHTLEHILRSAAPDNAYSLTWRKKPEVLTLTIAVKLPPPAPRERLPRRAGDAVPAAPVEQIADRLVKHYHLETEDADLKRRLADVTARSDAFRLPDIDFIQHHPFAIRHSAATLLEALQPRQQETTTQMAEHMLEQAHRLLRPEAAVSPLAVLRTGLTPPEHLAQLRQVLEETAALRAEAFKELSQADMEFLRLHLDILVKKFEEGNYLYLDAEPVRRDDHYQVIALASKVDLAALARAARSAVRLTAPDYVTGLRDDLERAALDLRVDVVLQEETPMGTIMIAGTGAQWHRDLEATRTAVLIDLGGDDIYANRAGSSLATLPVAIVVDLAGNDRYESSVDYALGTGYLGVGLLADLGGHDTYMGLRGTQGAAFLGAGLLLDASGNDVYRAHSYAQGSAFMGIAALVDAAGDERYESHLYSQAAGMAGGIAALLDGAGNDQYVASGFFPSGYGIPGTFGGWSQGVGIGLRSLVSGGLGVLHDGGGQDVMEGGDFSQGGGYYFGWGILHAAGTDDDRYLGSRYAQGFAAHYALGTFLEAGGNEVYDSRSGVANGIAWDLSITWFEDQGGNDRYPAQVFSTGASAHNAVSIFIDEGGSDRYEGTLPPANGQVNDYHGGTSLSLYFSSGAGDTRYAVPFPVPVTATGEYSFLFRVEGGLTQLLEGSYLESILGPIESTR